MCPHRNTTTHKYSVACDATSAGACVVKHCFLVQEMRTNKLRSLPFVLYSVWSLVLSLSRTAEQEAFSHVSPSRRRWAFLCETSESKGGRRLKLTTQFQAGLQFYDHYVSMGTAFMHKSLRKRWTDFDSCQGCLNIVSATSGIVQRSVWLSSSTDTRVVAALSSISTF